MFFTVSNNFHRGIFMKINFGTGRKPSSNTDQISQLRRKLLMGCAWLPAAPLLAMLGGCNEGDTRDAGTSTFRSGPEVPPANQSLNIGLPPYKTTDILPPPPNQKTDAQTTVEVTHIPEQPPAPSKPKKVGIYSLQYNSFTQVSTRKTVKAGTHRSISVIAPDQNGTTKLITYESIEDYLKRALDNRLALVYRAMVTAFEKHSPKEFDVSFFTVPEFFWNVPFGDFWTEAELQASTDLYLETVTRNARTLISKFPASQYGHIVLLPGTVAALKPSFNVLKPDGTTGTIYNAANHLVCTHNLPVNDKNYPRPAYMIWPKRVVSSIDYIDEANGGSCKRSIADLDKNPINPGVNNVLKECILNTKNGLTVRIEYVSSSVAQSFDSQGKLLSNSFQNDIIDGLPFGIDICLDYSEASVQNDEFRIAQLDEREFKLDFLIAAGMFLNVKNYANTPYIQYAIRNEGYSGTTGQTEVWKLTYDENKKTMSSKNATPLDAKSAFDVEKGFIPVDQTDAFVETPGIPKILDKMNPGNVRIWSLDIDAQDATGAADALVASNPPATMTKKSEIQIIK